MKITKDVSLGMNDVIIERERQIIDESWTPEHDDKYVQDELILASALYILASTYFGKASTFGGWVSLLWPWDIKWWKPTYRRRNLVKASALIVAELDRLDRQIEREALAKFRTLEKGEAYEDPKAPLGSADYQRRD